MTISEPTAPRPKRRSLGEQLNRSPRVIHASWLTGIAVAMSASWGGGFTIGGAVFLVLVFLPMIVAYRRDRLSFPIAFASLFLPAWPWAMYKALSRKPERHRDATAHAVEPCAYN